jgi:type VI secretion system secreted protein VgrG
MRQRSPQSAADRMPSPIEFTCPLPAEALRFESLVATQAVSALDSIEVSLVGEKPDVAAEKLLGQPASVVITLREGSKRHFSGLVARFGTGGARGRHFSYHVTLRPWLWFLTRTADCRIFQDLTVPEIVERVFADHEGIANFEFKLFRSYRRRVYCVQYRETDFNFVARLLEEEGIYWFFDHAENNHKLILVDDAGALTPAEGAEKLPCYDNTGQVPPDVDYVSGWSCAREVRTGKTVLTSYDFERPSAKLLVEKALARDHPLDDYEQFDFDGEYTDKADGQHLVECQIDEHQAQFDRVSGGTNAVALTVGHLFRLERHARADQNTEYLCLQASAAVRMEAYEAGLGAQDYQCSFSAMPSSQPLRPQRRTPKPFVQGPQTAVVVGPAGDEIHTDKYGRVKVQFHWDRYGRKDDKSSCWVRVSTPWAGKNFGVIHIPRIGQEVVVDFLEGDPDQPLITGRVYNAEQMPPWDLPANATQSGILTRSSKGGAYGNANAIRFEDKKGAEQLWIHAEKNQDIEVENDETHWVGHDRSKTIGYDETTHVKHDRTETVDNNETITIGVDRTESVGSNESISIGANRTETVGVNETITIGADRSITVGGSETATVALQRTHTVGVNETITVGAAQEVTIGAMQVITVGANQTVAVGVNQSESVGANQSVDVGAAQTVSVGADAGLTVGGAQSVSVGKARSTSVAGDDALKVGKNLVIDAGDAVTIKTGSASITMKKDGTITIKGKDITIDGSGKINVKASSDVVIKGSKILQN